MPTALYGVVLLMAAIAYYLLQQAIIRAQGPGSILKQAVGRDWKGKLSPLLYVLAIVATLWSPWISEAILVAVALIWLIPDRRIESVLPRRRPRGRSTLYTILDSGGPMSTAVRPASLLNRTLAEVDPEIARIVAAETARQNEAIELIASENFTSRAVMEAVGSILTNKYAEGYPGQALLRRLRPRGRGRVSRDRAREGALLAGRTRDAIHANVQPHAGSQANTAVYVACLKPGDTMMGMSLAHGGHLTHGHPLSISGKLYRIVSYGVGKETETIDWDAFEATARPRSRS